MVVMLLLLLSQSFWIYIKRFYYPGHRINSAPLMRAPYNQLPIHPQASIRFNQVVFLVLEKKHFSTHIYLHFWVELSLFLFLCVLVGFALKALLIAYTYFECASERVSERASESASGRECVYDMVELVVCYGHCQRSAFNWIFPFVWSAMVWIQVLLLWQE